MKQKRRIKARIPWTSCPHKIDVSFLSCDFSNSSKPNCITGVRQCNRHIHAFNLLFHFFCFCFRFCWWYFCTLGVCIVEMSDFNNTPSEHTTSIYWFIYLWLLVMSSQAYLLIYSKLKTAKTIRVLRKTLGNEMNNNNNEIKIIINSADDIRHKWTTATKWT